MHPETLQLIQILEKTVSPDKNELEQASNFLEQAAATNLIEFIKTLSDILRHGGNGSIARTAAGLQLKNQLTSKDPDVKNKYKARWLEFPDVIRTYIKKNIVAALGTESSRPSSAAQCVAYVAVTELPQNQWQDLIQTLVNNVIQTDSTEMQKEATLEAIGYICQEIDSEVLATQSNAILTAIIHGMRSLEPSHHVRLAATQALLNSLEFTRTNFDREAERNFIMEVVCEATQSTDTLIKVAALQCLVKILTLYYQYMEPYMAQALFPITLEAMKSDNEAVALQGIEFWSNVSDEEVDLSIEETEAAEIGRPPTRSSKHYAKGALQYIVPILLQKLTKQEELDDDDEWNPSKAACVCLMLLSTCCENELVPYMLPFIKENIKSEDWRFRDASVMAFSCMLGGLEASTLKPLVEQAMPTLIELMYDTSVVVRDTAAWTFSRICEMVPEAAINEQYLKPLLESLLRGLKAEPRVAANVCWAFNGLAESAHDAAAVNEEAETPETYCLSPYFDFIVQSLLETTERADGNNANLRPAAYEALMEMVKNSPKDCYFTVQKTTMVILERLQQVLQMETHIAGQNERAQFNDLQSLLCATLQSVLRKVSPEDAPKISDAIMTALLTMFSSYKSGGVQEDALMAVSTLVEVLGEGFVKYMDAFKPFLFLGLKNHQEHQVCGTAVGLTGDIFRALKLKALPYADEIMTLLLGNLSDSTVHRSVKPQILSAFGDIVLSIGPEFKKYLEVVLLTLTQASFTQVDRNDYDMIEYLNELRESVLDAYTGIIQGLKGDGPSPLPDVLLLQPHIAHIMQFISMIASDRDHSDGTVAVASGLVGDLCTAFGIPVLGMLDQENINEMLTEGRRSRETRTKTLATWATKELRKLKMSVGTGGGNGTAASGGVVAASWEQDFAYKRLPGMDSIPDSDFLTEQEKENARKETNVEFIKAFNARSFNYPKTTARKSAKDIQAFAEDKLVAKSFTEMRCDLPGAPRSTFLMVFSPDGTKVASTHGNHNIYISDVRTGKNVKTLMGHPRTPWCIAFHPTSNQIVASGCLGGQVRIWDLSGGSEVWSSENSTVIASLTFHPEDRLLVIATYNQLHFWDWSKPKPFASVSTATTKEKVRYVAFDPLGHKLITGISNNTTPQSRWERAQRCPASSLPRHGDYSPITSPNHPPTRHTYPPNNPTASSPPDPPRYIPATTSVFNNVPPYAGRSQRARLTSRILAHYRAFPPRNHSDALLFRNMFGEAALAMSLNRMMAQQQVHQQGAGGSAGRTDGSGSSWDVSSVRAEAGSEVDSLPDDDRSAIYSVRDTNAISSFVPSRSPLSSQATPMEQPIGELFTNNRPLSFTSNIRRDSAPRHMSRLDWRNLRATRTNSASGETTTQQQQPAETSRPPLPSLAGRREPLSSVPDRERRISACYRNLVREYEQLVHRYLQIYRPPVMIDRGTDPMDPGYPTIRQSAGLIVPQQQSSASTTRATNPNPATIQPLSSNNGHNPTDMRSVCEFTATDPSVLSPLRNYEIEAARRSSGEYNKVGARRGRPLNLEQRASKVRGTPSTSTAANNGDIIGESGVNSAKITLVLKSVEQALKGFEAPSTSQVAQLVETVSKEETPTASVQEAIATTVEKEEEQPASSEINLQSESNQQQQEVGAVCDNNSNQQEGVSDLITNLTIITSMAVQLKSFSQRLTLLKDIEERSKATSENTTENEQEVAGPSNSTPKEDVPVATIENITPSSDNVSVENAAAAAAAASSNSEAPNVAADIKLAKKMVEKIVEIMNTFSSQSCNTAGSNQPSTSSIQTNQPSTSTESNQPSTSNQTVESASASTRKRSYGLFKTKSNRKPILLDSSSDDSSDDEQKPRKMRKRPSLHKKKRCEQTNQTEPPSIALSSSDETQQQDASGGESNNVSINDNASDATSASIINDNASDVTSASMYNNVASDDIASTSDFTERRPWNYNRELEQLVTDLLHDNNESITPSESVTSESTSLLCSTCGDSLGTCTPNLCRSSNTLEGASAGTPTERRRRFFCHRLSAFHPTRVQTRFRHHRFRHSHLTNNSSNNREGSYFHSFNQQDTALDEVINYSQRSVESEQPSEQRSTGFVESSFASYHPFDPPPELDTINPEHIGIGNMYSNIVQELESSLSDIRNIRSQRRLGETSDMLSNFSERLESIMTQSHAILRNLSTSIDASPNEPIGNESSGLTGRNNNGRVGSTSSANNSPSWLATSNRDSVVPVESPAPLNSLNSRSSAANPQSVNADHSYPRPTSNMSPLMASLHLTVSHIWRQARLLRSQMDSIERIDRAMLELAQLRVMRQMFADLSLYFCISDHNIRGSNPHQTTGRQNRVANLLERSTSRTTEREQTSTSTTGTTTTTTTTTPDQTTVNSMRRMMAGTRISDESSTRRPPHSLTTSTHYHQRATAASSSRGPRSKLYPCVLVMHPRDIGRRPPTSSSGSSSSSSTAPPGSGVRLRGCAGSRAHPRQLTRRSLYRQMGGMGMGGMSMVDVAAPGRARNYMNLLNPDTFPALSHRLEHYLIEHGRLIGRHPTTNSSNSTSEAAGGAGSSSSPSAHSSSGGNNMAAERVLTVRLNNCRMRMHRLLGGRSQYGTNANTGPQSLVTRDGSNRYNARHTLCIMLDTLSRFMEVYGTGLVGISGSFRTYLREVIDLSRLLSEVLLLQIVDAIPPPTGMMLDPERENLAQRIDEMCTRMILTRLSSQSQPLTRCLRLMRLNVRFFSHAISQNRLLEERFTSTNVNTSLEPENHNQNDTREETVQSPSRPRIYSTRNTLDEVRIRQRENREAVTTLAPTQDPPPPQPAASAPPQQPPPPQPTDVQHSQPQSPQQQQQPPRQQSSLAGTVAGWRLQEFSARRRSPLLNEWRRGDSLNVVIGAGSATNTNMSELLYQRLGLDIVEDLPQPRVVVPRAEVTAANQYVRANSSTTPQSTPISRASSSALSSTTTTTPFPATLADLYPRPLRNNISSSHSSASVENQRFLDSITQHHAVLPPPALPPTTAVSPTWALYNNNNQTNAASSNSSSSISAAGGVGVVGSSSRESRVQQQQLQLQQQRRLYNGTADDTTSGVSTARTADERVVRQAREIMEGLGEGVEGRAGLYPMYYRSPGQWSLPEVQLNNVPILRDNQDNLYVQPGRNITSHPHHLHQHHQQRFQLHRDLLDEPVFVHQRGVAPGATPPTRAPLFSRPRLLHPLYTWSAHAQMNGQVGGLVDGGGGDEDRQEGGRVAGEQIYETDIIAAVTPNHRIQVWEFNRMGEGHAIIPNITNALKNVVVGECKIHNDASVDIATDGSVLVTLLPSNSYLNITNRLGIYSLEWETLGQILYITTFDQNAVSVSLSPLSRHLVVGLASRRVSIMPSEQWTLARIFLLDGRRMAFGRLSLMKEIEQSRETNFVMSVNCIRWLPTSGQGLVFATNTGQLRILN